MRGRGDGKERREEDISLFNKCLLSTYFLLGPLSCWLDNKAGSVPVLVELGLWGWSSLSEVCEWGAVRGGWRLAEGLRVLAHFT